jgi:hypothetical protein
VVIPFAIEWNSDTIGAAAGVAGVVIAVISAVIAVKGSRDARKAAREARLPRLTTTESPEVAAADAGALLVTFTMRNEGKGTARIVSYAARDSLKSPGPEARYPVLSDPKDDSLAGAQIAPGEYMKFKLLVSPDNQWFHEVVDTRGSWALEAVYTDVGAEDCICTRFGVRPGDADSSWSLTVPVQESRRL